MSDCDQDPTFDLPQQQPIQQNEQKTEQQQNTKPQQNIQQEQNIDELSNKQIISQIEKIDTINNIEEANIVNVHEEQTHSLQEVDEKKDDFNSSKNKEEIEQKDSNQMFGYQRKVSQVSVKSDILIAQETQIQRIRKKSSKLQAQQNDPFDQQRYVRIQQKARREKQLEQLKNLRDQFGKQRPFKHKILISTITSAIVTAITNATSKNKKLSAILGLSTFGLSFILQK